MPARPLVRWLAAPALITLTALAVVIGAADPGRGSPGAMASGDPTVIATISIGPGGGTPAGVAVNPTTNRIYVANQWSNNVSVIDGATNTVVATVPVGTCPEDVAVNPSTNRIYVANSGATTSR